MCKVFRDDETDFKGYYGWPQIVSIVRGRIWTRYLDFSSQASSPGQRAFLCVHSWLRPGVSKLSMGHTRCITTNSSLKVVSLSRSPGCSVRDCSRLLLGSEGRMEWWQSWVIVTDSAAHSAQTLCPLVPCRTSLITPGFRPVSCPHLWPHGKVNLSHKMKMNEVILFFIILWSMKFTGNYFGKNNPWIPYWGFMHTELQPWSTGQRLFLSRRDVLEWPGAGTICGWIWKVLRHTQGARLSEKEGMELVAGKHKV